MFFKTTSGITFFRVLFAMPFDNDDDDKFIGRLSISHSSNFLNLHLRFWKKKFKQISC
jgi:hypothetical protein